jgi:vacuolar-type H+-ATPase subunit E/Vma4
MKSTEESMKALSRVVLHQAKTEAEQIRGDAKAKADSIRKQAQDQVASERAAILELAQQKAEENRSQAIAAAQLKAHRFVLEHRELLLDHVFEVAEQRLPEITERTDYDQILRDLIHEAMACLGADDFSVQADEVSRKILVEGLVDEIAKDAKVNLHVGPVLERGTGVVVETSDGHRQYDNTLEARLNRSRENLRSPVYHLLMGDAV